MKKSIRGTGTEKNLMTAFANETQAVQRYSCFAEAARKEGYEHIAEIFAQTAKNEKAHAATLFKHLQDGGVEITATFPSGPVADTKTNLEKAIAGEKMTWEVRYADFAETANDEGLTRIALLFERLVVVENFHEERFKKLLDDLVHNEVFKKKRKVIWHCLNCGYIHQGTSAPKVCPACEYPRAFFEVLPGNE